MIKEEYSYERDKHNRPVGTKCVLTIYDVDDEFVQGAIGVAHCNLDSGDIPCKKVGRSIAKHRALTILDRAQKADANPVLAKRSGYVMGFVFNDESIADSL